MDGAELVRRAQGGDADAFARLVDRCSVRLLLFLRRHGAGVLGADCAAEDLLQTVLARAWALLGRFEDRGPNSFHRWLVALGKHAVQDRRRYVDAKGRRKALGEVAPLDGRAPLDPATSVSLVAARREEVARARAALDLLPAPQRAVVERHLLEGGTLREIAAALGISRNAAWERLHRGLAALRRVLESSTDPAVA